MKIVRIIALAVLLAGSLQGFAFQNQSASPTFSSTPSPTPSPSPNPPAFRPNKIRVSSGVAEGMVLHKVNPVYPWDAKVNHITGDVVLQITIDRQGHVANMLLVKGDPILAKSAIKAVGKWEYHP